MSNLALPMSLLAASKPALRRMMSGLNVYGKSEFVVEKREITFAFYEISRF